MNEVDVCVPLDEGVSCSALSECAPAELPSPLSCLWCAGLTAIAQAKISDDRVFRDVVFLGRKYTAAVRRVSLSMEGGVYAFCHVDVVAQLPSVHSHRKPCKLGSWMTLLPLQTRP